MRISKVLLSFEALVWSTWLTVGKVIPLVVKLSQKKQKKKTISSNNKTGCLDLRIISTLCDVMKTNIANN